MKSIQRYAVAMVKGDGIGWHPFMEPCKDGLYVSHADHVRELAALREELSALRKRSTHLLAYEMDKASALREACGGLIDFLERYPHQFAVDISGHEAALRAALQSGKEE